MLEFLCTKFLQIWLFILLVVDLVKEYVLALNPLLTGQSPLYTFFDAFVFSLFPF